jgi:hypothetical protein
LLAVLNVTAGNSAAANTEVTSSVVRVKWMKKCYIPECGVPTQCLSVQYDEKRHSNKYAFINWE